MDSLSRSNMMRLNQLCILVVLFLSKFVAAADVAELIDQRMQLMRSVAEYKWRHDIAIEDLEREARVVAKVRETALNEGITQASAEKLFRALISTAKEVQQYWFDQWTEYPASIQNAADLAHIRSELIRLGDEILFSISKLDDHVHREAFYQALTTEGITNNHRKQLLTAVQEVERYSNRLQQVLESGVLRVGSTGDYPPFTYSSDVASQYEGIDIELAKDLADSLGVSVRFVSTSWPGLMQDLQAGRYDIAMGGVSRTLERQRFGFFSPAYHRGGKAAIARCRESSRFTSLEQIDQQGIKVIVNPGGTNERFVDTQIEQASKILYPDNRTIFQQLLDGAADVMITDSIEVQLQSSLHKELCAVPAENFTIQYKAYLMPQDIYLKQYVDAWLSKRIEEGSVADTFRKFGVSIGE